MKVCTDACLFGAYVPVENFISILDIGTGTGLLALMLAQRTKENITAVEIDPNASVQAADNFKNSPFPNQIKVILTDIQSFASSSQEKFDLIISNPPFFQNNLKSNEKAINAARHNDTLSLEELAKSINALLTEDGRVYILLPEYEANMFESILNSYKLFRCDTLIIRQKSGSGVFRKIAGYSRVVQDKVPVNELIINSEPNEYSAEFKNLLKNYYLAF